LVTAALLGFSGYLATFFHIPEEHLNMAVTAFRLSAITFLFTSISSVFTQILQGLSRFDLASAHQSGISLLSSSAAIVLLKQGYDLLVLIQVDFFSSIVAVIAGFLFCRIAFGQNPVSFSISLAGIRSLLKEAAGQLTLSGLSKVLWELDSFLISRFFGITTMASYWMAQRLSMGWRTLLWAGAWPAVPATSESSPEAESRLKKIHWMQVSLSVPLAACLWNLSDEIIRLWAGAPDPQASFCLKTLVLAGIIDFLPATFVSHLFARGRVFLVARIMLGAAIAKVAVAGIACYSANIVLLLAATVAGATMFSIFIHVVAFKTIKHSFKYSMMSLVPAVLASFVSHTVLAVFQRPDSLVNTVWFGVLFLGLAYSIVLLILRLFFGELYRSFRVQIFPQGSV
ncbi:MAG: oligosaccharide flippase family protein, partial [Acidobacteriota bacterium]